MKCILTRRCTWFDNSPDIHLSAQVYVNRWRYLCQLPPPLPLPKLLPLPKMVPPLWLRVPVVFSLLLML